MKRNIGKYIVKIAGKHGATALTIVAGIGVIATAIFASKEREEADERIVRAKEDKAISEAETNGTAPDFDHVKLTFWESVKAAAPAYVKTGVAVVLTIACVVGSHVMSIRQMGDLAAAYNVAQMANSKWEKYSDKVKEELGVEKEAEIRHAANAEQLPKEGLYASQAIFTGDGNQLIRDVWSGRLFYSSVPFIKEQFADMNLSLTGGFSQAKMNEAYDKIHLPNTKAGDSFMFDVVDSYSKIEARFTPSDTLTEDGFSYIDMDFENDPKPILRRW